MNDNSKYTYIILTPSKEQHITHLHPTQRCLDPPP